jgi:V8-like Glu-specific endopeptidase
MVNYGTAYVLTPEIWDHVYRDIGHAYNDVKRSETSSRIQVGEEVLETFEISHPFEGVGIVWEHTFHWPKSGYISIHFTEFDLSPGDYIEISSPDGRYSYRYEEKGKVVRGGEAVLSDFWATHIPGDAAIVRMSRGNSGEASHFTIDKWSHGYPVEVINDLLGDGGGTDAICGNDDKEWAKCYEGTPIYEKSRAVARLLIGGSGGCTGWLLGSEGHVMTNKHCIENQNEADNTDYEFMAEGATCQTNCVGWFVCPGTVEASSGNLIRSDYNLDYSLILLPTNVTPTYGYFQLRETLPEVGERMYIPQHPGGWGKQIAVYDDQIGSDCEVHSTNESPCFGGPGDIGYLCDTNNGSSGSPVIAYADHAVISLHHCAYCPNRGVPIPPIIADLGDDLPANAIVTSVIPDIKANGSDKPVTISEGEMLVLTISLDPGRLEGQLADWWLVAESTLGQFWFELRSGWIRSDTPILAYGGPLITIDSYSVLETTGLQAGEYDVYFAVDDNANGIPDYTYRDSVLVTVVE